jgi:metal-responsive CopG/Arc/MetJ family transcriptional regulator
MHKAIGISLSEDVLKQIDERRGFASRSIVIDNMLRERLRTEGLPPSSNHLKAGDTDQNRKLGV